jgi:hypothetical protein
MPIPVASSRPGIGAVEDVEGFGQIYTGGTFSSSKNKVSQAVMGYTDCNGNPGAQWLSFVDGDGKGALGGDLGGPTIGSGSVTGIIESWDRSGSGDFFATEVTGFASWINAWSYFDSYKDSDGGLNYETYGMVQHWIDALMCGGYSPNAYPDACLDGDTLREAYTAGGASCVTSPILTQTVRGVRVDDHRVVSTRPGGSLDSTERSSAPHRAVDSSGRGGPSTRPCGRVLCTSR